MMPTHSEYDFTGLHAGDNHDRDHQSTRLIGSKAHYRNKRQLTDKKQEQLQQHRKSEQYRQLTTHIYNTSRTQHQ